MPVPFQISRLYPMSSLVAQNCSGPIDFPPIGRYFLLLLGMLSFHFFEWTLNTERELNVQGPVWNSLQSLVFSGFDWGFGCPALIRLYLFSSVNLPGKFNLRG